jgi:hypothetical protein
MTAEPFRSTLNDFEDAMKAQARPAPIKAAHELLLTKLAALTDFVPRISIDPNPSEFEDVETYIRDAVGFFDQWLSAIGNEIKANASCRIDESVFKDRFLNAVEGEATAEITRCADRVREDRAA